jgi:hypothetical protein
VTSAGFYSLILFLAIHCGVLAVTCRSEAQSPPSTPSQSDPPELSLRKSVKSRDYQGRQYEGEERQIGRGDSLWRILVEEKGLPGQKFRSYLVVIRGLNPQVKNLDVLRIGDKIFVPLRLEQSAETRRPNEPAGERGQVETGATITYRVKAGEHLYQILREQLKLTDERKLAQYYSLVKDLNPQRKDWDTLLEGESIRLPALGGGRDIASAETAKAPPGKTKLETIVAPQLKAQPETETAPTPFDARQALRSPAKENLPLLASVMEAMGNEMRQSGEEAVILKEGAIRFERSAYPVVYNSALRQRMVIDPDGKIPASLKAKLSDPNIATPVVAMANGISIQDAVTQSLAALGYQSLPNDRPVVIQEEGVIFEAKGSWMVLAPEVSNKPQEVYVINLVNQASEIPDYLQLELAKKGLLVRDVVLPASNTQPTRSQTDAPVLGSPQVKNWPRDKQAIVDALLLAYGITFGVGENLSVELNAGLHMEVRSDRVFELGGQRMGLFFHATEPEIRRSLQEKQGMKIVELDFKSLSTRELISRVLTLLGDQSTYREHRFSATSGSTQDRLMVKAWGFQLSKKPIFVTDRQIPAALQRFFFEKGLEIIYFQ